MTVSIMFASVLSLTAISVNRYYIINHMKNENMNVRFTNYRAIHPVCPKVLKMMFWIVP